MKSLANLKILSAESLTPKIIHYGSSNRDMKQAYMDLANLKNLGYDMLALDYSLGGIVTTPKVKKSELESLPLGLSQLGYEMVDLE